MYFQSSKRIVDLPEKQRWISLLCAGYVKILLKAKYEEGKRDHIEASCICSDGRRVSTVRRHLEKEGLIQVSHDKDSSFKCIPEAVEKLLPRYVEVPEFDVGGYFENNGSRRAAKNILECYRKLQGLNNAESIYVYLHEDEFDIRIEEKTRRHPNSRYKSSATYKVVKIFPKKKIKELNDSILEANALEHASRNAAEIIPQIIGKPLRALESNNRKYVLSSANKPEWIFIPDDMEWTEKELTLRLQETLRKRRLLDRASKELLAIRRQLRATGGDEKFKELLTRTAYKTILEEAPLKINDEDNETRHLARMFMSGDASPTS